MAAERGELESCGFQICLQPGDRRRIAAELLEPSMHVGREFAGSELDGVEAEFLRAGERLLAVQGAEHSSQHAQLHPTSALPELDTITRAWYLPDQHPSEQSTNCPSINKSHRRSRSAFARRRAPEEPQWRAPWRSHRFSGASSAQSSARGR